MPRATASELNVMAKKYGFNRAEFSDTWKGYAVYIAMDDGEQADTGYPILFATNENETKTLDFKETKEYMRFFSDNHPEIQ